MRSDGSDSRETETYGFLLTPGFALMSLAAATEPLRAANLISGRELYRALLLSVDGRPVRASNGLCIECAPLAAGAGLHTLFVCAGGGPADWSHPAVFSVLRQCAQAGVRIGGISGGPYLMAAAGLLEGRDFTIHWEHAPALAEAFPRLRPRQARFVIDDARITCGGGVAPLDMMHALIRARMGEVFARRVSDWYLHTAVGDSSDPQRASVAERYKVDHPLLQDTLTRMEAAIERPLGRAQLARQAGISERHLDRLFRKHAGQAFLATYLRIRLARGRQLLLQSALSISEIAVATGFSSSGHFARSFKSVYGLTPTQAKRQSIRSP